MVRPICTCGWGGWHGAPRHGGHGLPFSWLICGLVDSVRRLKSKVQGIGGMKVEKCARCDHGDCPKDDRQAPLAGHQGNDSSEKKKEGENHHESRLHTSGARLAES